MEWTVRGGSRVISSHGLVGTNCRICATPYTGGNHCEQTTMRRHVGWNGNTRATAVLEMWQLQHQQLDGTYEEL
eukprot:9115553-Ditylum_brightwellii.AAC.1